MPQYGVFVLSPAPADPESITPEYLEGLERYPAHVEELGGTIVTGFAFQSDATAVSIFGDEVTDGAFGDGTHVVAGFYVLDAPNQETAVKIAALNPATKDGGVEVRPLFEPPAE